jgi:hypothetical protein
MRPGRAQSDRAEVRDGAALRLGLGIADAATLNSRPCARNPPVFPTYATDATIRAGSSRCTFSVHWLI